MAKLIVTSEVVMEILNREIPKLFSDEGNRVYRTDDVEVNFLDRNGNDLYDVSDWNLEIKERM